MWGRLERWRGSTEGGPGREGGKVVICDVSQGEVASSRGGEGMGSTRAPLYVNTITTYDTGVGRDLL